MQNEGVLQVPNACLSGLLLCEKPGAKRTLFKPRGATYAEHKTLACLAGRQVFVSTENLSCWSAGLQHDVEQTQVSLLFHMTRKAAGHSLDSVSDNQTRKLPKKNSSMELAVI